MEPILISLDKELFSKEKHSTAAIFVDDGVSIKYDASTAVENGGLVFSMYQTLKDTCINLKGRYRRVTVEEFLGFMEGETLKIDSTNVLQLLQISREFGVPLIEEYCTVYLENNQETLFNPHSSQ